MNIKGRINMKTGSFIFTAVCFLLLAGCGYQKPQVFGVSQTKWQKMSAKRQDRQVRHYTQYAVPLDKSAYTDHYPNTAKQRPTPVFVKKVRPPNYVLKG